jgi:hypothetical protein
VHRLLIAVRSRSGRLKRDIVLVSNRTQQTLAVPPINVGASDFSLARPPPSGISLQPGKQAGFVQFMPTVAGKRTGSFAIGARIYTLTGTGVAPAMPKPRLTVALPLAQSVQQGAVAVAYDGPAATAGSGIVTLQFLPALAVASDPAIAFASCDRTASITFAAGDIQATIGTGRIAAFQTGTTAGTIILSAQAGTVSDQQLVAIMIAPVAFSSTQGSRSPGSIQVSTIRAPPAACPSLLRQRPKPDFAWRHYGRRTAALAQLFKLLCRRQFSAQSCFSRDW